VTLARNLEFDFDQSWRSKAACKDASDPDIFFPVGVTGAAIGQIRQAKRVCNSCEARSDCLEFALATNQECGVWGATTEDERRKLRRAWLAKKRESALATA
jgi:WhiB family redox-sensing transcriptional regulator